MQNFHTLRLVFGLLLMAFVLPVMGGEPFNGYVCDLTGTPLKGVRVYLHSEGYAARSDKKGRFGLTDVQPTDTLHIIYKRQEYSVPVSGRRSLSIRLGDQCIDRAEEDQDLIFLGYNYVKRREVLEPTSGIRGEDLVRCGYNNLLQALQGRVAGLNISMRGEAGAEPSVNIRGQRSIMLSNRPLFIVDGVEVESLDFVSIYDVDVVEVLKSAPIYGSRGANGAIIVTTKQPR